MLRFLDVRRLEPLAWGSPAPSRPRSADSPSRFSTGKGLVCLGEKYFDFEPEENRDIPSRSGWMGVASLSSSGSVGMIQARTER